MMEGVTLHLAFPSWFSRYMHHVYDHAVHHAEPAIPSYHLHAAQLTLNRLAPGHAVSRRFSPRLFWDTLRGCKLYDYDRHLWPDFDGRPTTAPILRAPAAARGALPDLAIAAE